MTTDPRKIPGNIVGPSNPHGHNDVIIDASNAILLDYQNVALITGSSHNHPAIAMQLSGRINRSKDRADILVIFGVDGAAAIISELAALFGRAGIMDAEGFLKDLIERIQKLRAEGNLSP